MIKSTQPAWLKDVQQLSSPEIEKIEANIKSGKLTEEQASSPLIHAAMRAVGKQLTAEPKKP